MGRRQVIGWWLAFVAGCAVAWTALVLVSVGGGHPAVIRVVGDGSDLWAYTQERVAMQGVDVAWWVSHDGGATWSSGTPAAAVAEADPQEEGCSHRICFKLVGGWRIDEADGEGIYSPAHRRPREDAPPPADAGRSDWVEERSIAVVPRAGTGPDTASVGDPATVAVAVAMGDDGALVRTDEGRWQTVVVGHSWDEPYRWWVAGLGSAAIVIAGLGLLGVGLLIERRRRAGEQAPTDPVASTGSRF